MQPPGKPFSRLRPGDARLKKAMKKNIKITKSLFLGLCIIVFINSCETEQTGGGKVFKGSIVEEIFIIAERDTINIVLEQTIFNPTKDTIPKIHSGANNNSDVIEMHLFVSYESFNENPEFIKEVDNHSDTIFVWFSIKEKYSPLSKTNTILEIENSPIIESSVIDSIRIESSIFKNVNIIEKYLE